jgi:hypothetical protein
MFIQTEPTPNPNVLKFLPGQQFVDAGQVVVDQGALLPPFFSAAKQVE